MPKLSLKSIIGKNNEGKQLLDTLLHAMNGRVLIEDETGKILYGEAADTPETFPVHTEQGNIGVVRGGKEAAGIAALLNYLVEKEAEKKRLGSEILNLYKEINLIFNFSEKLAQTIDARSICDITLDEARQIIEATNGVVVLWDEENRKLQVAASFGELFFEEAVINTKLSQLLKMILSGQSEIVTETGALKQSQIINENIQCLLYSALKVNHRIMGAIILATTKEASYTAADLKMLTTLGLQSSAAIESALLYEKNIRESRNREEAMRRVYEATEKFVPYEFLESLGRKVITDVRLGDQVEKIVTVLFCDIRDFTTLSEQMTPEENFRFVCSFNEKMGPAIRNNKGFVNQYLGDAIMAIFPFSAADALKAAVEMQHILNHINTDRRSRNEMPIRIGIGMHTGPLIMGITGDKDRLDATTISDTVNTAARLESLTKYYNVGIIISEASMVQINKEMYHLRYLGPVQLKGKTEPIHIHECYDCDREADILAKQRTLPLFTVGIENYLKRDFETSVNAFQTIGEIHPADKTASFFLERAQMLLAKGAPENWAGVMEMAGK